MMESNQIGNELDRFLAREDRAYRRRLALYVAAFVAGLIVLAVL